jgi:hypothetical protein
LHILLTVPSRGGWHPSTVSCVFNMKTVVEKAGHGLHLATLYRMPLDIARNELMTAMLSTTADVQLALDDDCWLETALNPVGVLTMLAAIEAGVDIVSAPCLMRGLDEMGLQRFNIQPVTMSTPIETRGGVRLVECQWSGFGCIMIVRHVLEKLHADAVEHDAELREEIKHDVYDGRVEPQTYASQVVHGKISASIFKTRNVPASTYMKGAPDVNVVALDDKAFCLKARKAGFKIHAAIDVTTSHDGMTGNFAEEMARRQAARAIAEAPAPTGASGLVDNMGRPLR